MGPKTSVKTCFMGNSPLKNSILRSKTPIKVKEKNLNSFNFKWISRHVFQLFMTKKVAQTDLSAQSKSPRYSFDHTCQTLTVFVENAKNHTRSLLALPKTPQICLRRLGVNRWWFRKAFQTFSEPLAWA